MVVKFSESGHPVFRATLPVSRGVHKSKGGGKLSVHFCVDGDTIETVFRTIISVNQLSIYGAVSDLCEGYKSFHVRTGRLVVAGQSNPLFVPSVMKTHIHLTDDPAQQKEDLLQRYQERIEKLSQQKTNVLASASRSKAKTKPQRRISASSSTKTVPIGERKWTDNEPEDYSPIAYPVSKQLSTLLRHGHLPREDDGAIEFWRFKDYLRNDFM